MSGIWSVVEGLVIAVRAIVKRREKVRRNVKADTIRVWREGPDGALTPVDLDEERKK